MTALPTQPEGARMTTIDRSDASDEELAAHVARFGIFDAEERVELAIVRSLDSDDPNDWEPRALAAAAIAALGESTAEVARLSPDGDLVAIRRGANDWRVSNGGHYRDQHVADWTPLAPRTTR